MFICIKYYIHTVDSRQTDRQTGRQTDRQIDRQTDINPQNIEKQIPTKIDFLSCFGGCYRYILLAPGACAVGGFNISMEFGNSVR